MNALLLLVVEISCSHRHLTLERAFVLRVGMRLLSSIPLRLLRDWLKGKRESTSTRMIPTVNLSQLVFLVSQLRLAQRVELRRPHWCPSRVPSSSFCISVLGGSTLSRRVKKGCQYHFELFAVSEAD